MKFRAAELRAKLPLPANEKWTKGVWDVEPFKKGNVSLVFFAPRVVDNQTAHDEDEFYFIVRGSGDAFFVEAGVPHRFENFTDDFATWAVFF